jgi:hypothetical protein
MFLERIERELAAGEAWATLSYCQSDLALEIRDYWEMEQEEPSFSRKISPQNYVEVRRDRTTKPRLFLSKFKLP